MTSMLDRAISVALESRSLARTFMTAVGASILTRDGKIFGGFNLESYGHWGLHAEVVALVNALGKGYNGKDFDRLIVAFPSKYEVYIACPECWKWLWEFTHPNLIIYVVNMDGEIQYDCQLWQVLGTSGNDRVKIYPS